MVAAIVLSTFVFLSVYCKNEQNLKNETTVMKKNHIFTARWNTINVGVAKKTKALLRKPK